MSEQNQFSEYARSAAFRIDLSASMITALLNVGTEDAYTPDRRLILQPYWALKRRGLIEWVMVDGMNKGPRLSPAGERVFDLLVLAGFGEGLDTLKESNAKTE